VDSRHCAPRDFLSPQRDIATSVARRFARTLTYSWYALLEQVALRNATSIVVPSRGLARELQTTYPHLTQAKVRIIPNPVDTATLRRPPNFDFRAVYDDLHIPPEAFVLSFCALASFTAKGLGIVLEALSSLANSTIHLLVIGGHPGEIAEYSRLAQRLGVTTNVHFVGLRTDVRPYLWSSHAFVFPSAYETFSLACFEAAAAGLPIIATRVYGVEDLLIDGVNGWVVQRTPASVAAAIGAAAASPTRSAMMGQEAQVAVQPYDTRNYQVRWLELLQNEYGFSPLEEMHLAHQ
jgi:glycosyltransferase involved in cell wall biosynthesis